MSQKTDVDNIQGPKDGDTIILFVDQFDPPTMDHAKAVTALSSHGKWIWICPLTPVGDGQKVRDMSSILATDLKSMGAEASLCTVALDKKLDVEGLLVWVNKRFPTFKFITASLKDNIFDKKGTTLCIRIGKSGQTIPAGGQLVLIEQCLAVPVDIQKRIANGSDESRHIMKPVWDYIQKHHLYRG